MNRLDGFDKLSLASIGGAAAITGALYARLPERVPTHFNLYGEADAWMSKPIGACMLLAFAAGTWAVVRFGAAILPRGFRERLAASPVSVLALLTTLLFSTLQLLILWSSLHASGNIGRPFAIAFGLYWIVLAQVLPRVRRNPFVGVRTTWTLTSDENWARTHRLAGRVFTLGGLVAVIAGLAAAPAAALIAIVLSALVPVIWSFVLAHRLT